MKYEPEIVESICANIIEGHNQRDAALLVGIGESTFYKWLEKIEFLESIKKAHAEYKLKHLKVIQVASSKTWQASAWILERRYKKEFAIRQEHSDPEGKPLKTIIFVDAENSSGNGNIPQEQAEPSKNGN